MESPENEIEHVIRHLTQTSPSLQRYTIETYFTPNASFCHPFCRTGSFDGSRYLIRAIYRWYKILSPHIELEVNGIAYDKEHLTLYVDIHQVFRIWAVPFYRASVNLTTVLKLTQEKSSGKYYIHSQNDLYQVDQFVRFVWPGGIIFIWTWQILATIMCLLGAILFWPISLIEEKSHSHAPLDRSGSGYSSEAMVEEVPGSGHFVAPPAIQQR